MIKKFLLFSFCLLVFTSVAQEMRLKKGVVIDSLALPNTDATFALYLPMDFDLERPHQLLVVFDPEGRAFPATSLFIATAETFGVVVAAINSPIKTESQANFSLYNTLSTHLFGLLPKLDTEVYLAGFGEAAQFATAVGVLADTVAGVIGCGDGFSLNRLYMLQQAKFTFVGIVGDEDFNYHKLGKSQAFLNRKKIKNELLIFSGSHQWPTPDYLLRAFSWFFVKEAVLGKRPDNKATLSKLYNIHYQHALKLYDEKQYFFAEKEFASIDKNYRAFYDTDSIVKRAKALKRLKAFKVFRREEANFALYETSLVKAYITLLEEDIKNASFQNFEFWEEEFNNLKPNTESSISGVKRAKRTKNALFEFTKSQLQNYTEEKAIDQLIFIHEFMVYLNPTYFDSYLNLITYYTKQEEYDYALSSLSALLNQGYTNKNHIRLMPDITMLKTRPEFWELLQEN
jgi:hypothetical protein